MFKSNPLFFINFLLFFNVHCFYCNCCVLLKRLLKLCFQKSTAFQKTAKKHFFAHCKNTFFKKRCHFTFWAISAETTIFIVFFLENILAKTDRVHEIARFFSFPDTITWPHFGHFKVNNLATSRSITWPPFFEPIKIVFFEFFQCTVFRGWCKISVLKSCFLVKKRGFRKKGCALFWGGLRV